MVIVGASGVGKTRLAEEAVAGAARRSVITVVGAPATQGLPLAPLLAVFPEVSVAPDRGIAEIQARLAGHRTPLTLVVDDAQWLDPTTQTLLHLLVTARHARLVITVRDDLPMPITILNLCKNGRLARVHLDPLSPAESAEFVTGMIGAPAEAAVVAELFGRSQGLPLALRELTAEALLAGAVEVRDGSARAVRPLPRSRQLGEVIVSNLETAHPGWRAVLSVVALAEPMPLGLLAEVVDEVDLIAAEKQGLIRVTTSVLPGTAGPVVTVGHPLYREVALAAFSPLARHRTLDDLVRAAPPFASGNEALTLRLAAWRLEVGRPVPAEDLLTALRLAHRAIDPGKAAALARELWRDRPDFETGLLYATALNRQQRHDLADDVLRRVKQFSLTEPQRVTRASLANEVLARLGRHDEAIEELRQAEETVTDRGARAHLTVRRAFTTSLLGRTRQALEVVGPLLHHSGPHELREATPFVPYMLGLDGRAEEALTLVHRAEQLDLTDNDPSPDYLPTPQTLDRQRCHGLLYSGRLSEAAECAQIGIRTAEEIGLDYMLAEWLNISGRVELERGHPATAILVLGRVLAETPSVSGGAQRAVALNGLIEAHALLGQPHAARQALTALAEKPCNTPWHPAGLAELSRGYLAAAEGRPAAALGLFQGAYERAAPANAWVALTAAHAIARYGRREIGLARARQLPDVQGPLAPLRLAHLTALAADDAAGLLELAPQFERLGADLLAAEACAVATEIATRRGDSRLAMSARRTGGDLAARTEGTRTPDRLGLSHAAVPHLTRREREIATLAARGLSSQTIAAELTLSVRTVDNNLLRVYHKLGVKGRQELAETIAPIDPQSPN